MTLEREGNNSRSHILEMVSDGKRARVSIGLSVMCWKHFTSFEVYLKVNSAMRISMQGKRRLKKKKKRCIHCIHFYTECGLCTV